MTRRRATNEMRRTRMRTRSSNTRKISQRNTRHAALRRSRKGTGGLDFDNKWWSESDSHKMLLKDTDLANNRYVYIIGKHTHRDKKDKVGIAKKKRNF